MNKAEIITSMQKNHADFIALIASLNENDFCKQVDDKWTPAQQAKHIYKSAHPVNLALSLPLFIPALLFGKANRSSGTYDALVEKYHAKLAAGYKAGKAFVPKAINFSEQKKLAIQLQQLIDALCRKTDRLSEEELDQYILPHPLLGKLTYREMLYFTAYHVQHHQSSVEKIIQS